MTWRCWVDDKKYERLTTCIYRGMLLSPQRRPAAWRRSAPANPMGVGWQHQPPHSGWLPAVVVLRPARSRLTAAAPTAASQDEISRIQRQALDELPIIKKHYAHSLALLLAWETKPDAVRCTRLCVDESAYILFAVQVCRHRTTFV